jgi:hypothetical protein
MPTLKLIPHLLAWGAMLPIFLRGSSGQRVTVAVLSAGFAAGAISVFALFNVAPEAMVFSGVKSAMGVSFLLLWGVAVTVIYQSTGRGRGMLLGEQLLAKRLPAGVFAILAGFLAGAVCASRMQGFNPTPLHLVLVVVTGGAISYGAWLLERVLPESFRVSPVGLLTAVVALLLFSSSSLLRLDLFSPLSMKVMKGIHDFVHQFMESILIPDHLFVRSVVWGYIGLLFGKGVGFWGGIIIWFTPVLLIALAIGFEKLPSVAHIREGARRRKLLAAAVREKRRLLITPLFSAAIFAAAAYQSSFPTVEYWDPKPEPVTASPSGEIVIPKKGTIDLEDGKLHKYLLKQGGQEVRFFVLLSPNRQLTVDLDACAICKPDGYGQAEGSVICYYCKTLIPLDTVGKPGGCNPVPVQFTDKGDGVAIDAITLINAWSATVKATTKVKEGGK